jgi:hypothetical protein
MSHRLAGLPGATPTQERFRGPVPHCAEYARLALFE